MPLTPELRGGIDRIRNYLFGGGYPNPAQNAEQLSFLFFFYMFEAADAARVRAARRPGAAPYTSAFDGWWSLRNTRNARTPGEETVPRDSREDLRTYGVGARILLDLGVRRMRVLSAPKRIHGLSGFGLEVVEYIES